MKQRHSIDFLFPLSLFCVFTICAFLVVMTGAGIYQRIADNMEDTYSTGTAFSYVTEKLRQHDAAGRIALTEADGTAALVLTDGSGDSMYQTYIYPFEESLCEAVVKEGSALSPSRADAVLQIKDFAFEEKPGGFLELSATDSSGDRVSRLVYIQSGIRSLSEEEGSQP